MKKQILLFLMMLLPMVASADDSGSCGNNVTYSFKESTHTLTISGTGAMKDFPSIYFQPWYSYRDKIFYVIIKSGVTSIGDWAFCVCSSLTSVTIPNGVTSIGDDAFYECSGLTSVTIPNSVTSIGDAFSGCSGLTSIVVNSGNTVYDSRGGCNAIIKKSNNELIVGCKNTSIPNSVTSIGKYAFYGCSGLTSVTIPNSVKTIDSGAFYGCSGLTSVTIPNSVTSIGGSAFSYCSSLTSVTIPNSVTSIGYTAFSDCSGLKDVYCHAEAVPNTSGYAFDNTPINEATLHVPQASISAYKAKGPWSRFGKIVALTGGGGGGADDSGSCGNNVTYSFNESTHTLTISGTGAMKDYDRNNQPWDSYSDKIFYVIIKSGVTSIGKYAFYYCRGLTSVTIPNSVTTIGDLAFEDCRGLTSVTIPNSVTSIGEGAFYDCSGLTSVTIGNSVTSIGPAAFRYCSGLTSVTIPNSVTSIGDRAFSDCSGLTSIVVNSGNTVYDSRGGCNAIIKKSNNKLIAGCKNTTIPSSVTSIGKYAFDGCSGLTSVTIGNSVTSIGEYAFRNCTGLTSVTIPNSVTSIGGYAFSFCTVLKDVYCHAEAVPNTKTSAFNNTPINEATLHVPQASISAYQAAEPWSGFGKIVALAGGELPATGDGGADYGTDIGGDTNLDGNVVGNIYYAIGDGDGGYNAAEGCIVVNTPTSDDNIDGQDIFGEDFKDHFTGIVFKVEAGSGVIKVKAQTTGSMMLKVKIGSNVPSEMMLSGMVEASFPYSVSEPTYVYIYGGILSGSRSLRAAGENSLKIYGVSWQETSSSIVSLESEPDNAVYYDLSGQRVTSPQRGHVYIVNRRKVVIK